MKSSQYISLKKVSPLFWLITIHLIILAYWLKRDHSFLINDGFDHYIVTLLKQNTFSNFFFASDIIKENISYFIKWHGTFPESISAILLLFIPISQDTAVFINSFIFFSTTIVFIYLSAMLFLPKKTAFLSAAIFSLLPVTGQHLRIFMSDMPLTAMTTASIYFLIKTHRSSTIKNYLLFIIFTLCAFFTKVNTALFLIFPTVVFLFYNRKKTSTQITFSILIIIFLSTTIMKPIVFKRVFSCLWLPIYKGVLYPGLIDTIVLSTFDFLLTSFYDLFNHALSSIVFLSAITGCFALLYKKQYKLLLLLLGFIFTPVLLMSSLLFIEYDLRYLMPIMPFICILAASTLYPIQKKKIYISLAGFLLLFLTINHYRLFFTANTLNLSHKIPLNTFIVKTLNRQNVKNLFNLTPYKFYSETTVLHSSAEDLYLFTPKNQNLFRSSLKMDFETQLMKEYSTTVEIMSKISKTKTSTLFLIGKNRLIYNLLLENITLNEIPCTIYKYENIDQIKHVNISEYIKETDYIVISDNPDEIFIDSSVIKKDYIEKTKNIRQNIKNILSGFQIIYKNKIADSQTTMFQKIKDL